MLSTVERQKPVSDVEMEAAVDRLGVFLPPDYEKFLQSSNGLIFEGVSINFSGPSSAFFPFQAKSLLGLQSVMNEKMRMGYLPHTIIPIMSSVNDSWILMDVINSHLLFLPHASLAHDLNVTHHYLYRIVNAPDDTPVHFSQMLNHIEIKLKSCLHMLAFSVVQGR